MTAQDAAEMRTLKVILELQKVQLADQLAATGRREAGPIAAADATQEWTGLSGEVFAAVAKWLVFDPAPPLDGTATEEPLIFVRSRNRSSPHGITGRAKLPVLRRLDGLH
jgi:hypothetical protein